MHFSYCPLCGTKLVHKEIGDEGLLPYCETCARPFWDMFATSVICAVVDEAQEIALLRQEYVSKNCYVCVAGIVQMGETAEETARREIWEEIGQQVQDLEYVDSYFFDGKEMLMLGYLAHVRKRPFRLSGEVDQAVWVPLKQAAELLPEKGIAKKLVERVSQRMQA